MEAARSMSEERLMDLEKRVRLLEERAHRVLWSAPQTGMSRADELAARYGEYVDKTTAAGILGVSERTVTRMCEQGKLKAVKVMSLWRINRDRLLDFAGLN